MTTKEKPPDCLLSYLVGGDLHNWSRVHLSRIKIVVNDSKDHNSACHQAAEIHMRSVRINRLRKEAEYEDNDAIPNTKSIEKDAPDPRNMKRPPDEFVSMPCGAGHLGGVTNRSSDAVPKEESLGQDVRSVETADTNGDNIIESGCRADIDQTNGTRNAGHNNDGIQWNSGVGLDLEDCVSSNVTKNEERI